MHYAKFLICNQKKVFDDITKALVGSLEKAGIFTEEEIEMVKNGETNEEIIDKIMNM